MRPAWRALALLVACSVVGLVAWTVGHDAAAQGQPAQGTPAADAPRLSPEEARKQDQEELKTAEQAEAEARRGLQAVKSEAVPLGSTPSALAEQAERLREAERRLWTAEAATYDARYWLGLPPIRDEHFLGMPVERGRDGRRADPVADKVQRAIDYVRRAYQGLEAWNEKHPCPTDDAEAAWEAYLDRAAQALACCVADSDLAADLEGEAGRSGRASDADRALLRRYATAVGTRAEQQALVRSLLAALRQCWEPRKDRLVGWRAPEDAFMKERILARVNGEFGCKRIEMEWVGLEWKPTVRAAECEGGSCPPNDAAGASKIGAPPTSGPPPGQGQPGGAPK